MTTDELKRDVKGNPEKYIVFNSFPQLRDFLYNIGDAYTHENDPEKTRNGIMGYYEGKTVVIIPLW